MEWWMAISRWALTVNWDAVLGLVAPLGVAASTLVAVAAWRTSVRATRASELAAEAARKALDIESQRDERARRSALGAVLQDVRSELVQATVTAMSFEGATGTRLDELKEERARRLILARQRIKDARALDIDEDQAKALTVFDSKISEAYKAPNDESPYILTAIENVIVGWQGGVVATAHLAGFIDHMAAERRAAGGS